MLTVVDKPKQGLIECWTHDCDPGNIFLREVPPTPTCIKCEGLEPMKKISHVVSPFINARQAPRDFVIIPSQGRFTDSSFSPSNGLHIGVTNYEGQVISFDKFGYQAEVRCGGRWNECIPLEFIDRSFGSIPDSGADGVCIKSAWDNLIRNFLNDERWILKDPFNKPYHPQENNCFDFALSVLRKFIDLLRDLRGSSIIETGLSDDILNRLDELVKSKESFCEELVLPKTKEAAKYLFLRRCMRSGSVHQNNQSLKRKMTI